MTASLVVVMAGLNDWPFPSKQFDGHSRIGHPGEVGVDDIGDVVTLHSGVVRGEHRQVRRRIRSRSLDREIHDRAEVEPLELVALA